MEFNMIKMIIYYTIDIKKENATLEDAIELLKQEIQLSKENKSIFRECKEEKVNEIFEEFNNMDSGDYKKIVKSSMAKISYYNAICPHATFITENTEAEIEELPYIIINFNKGMEQIQEESSKDIYAMNELGERYLYANMDKEAFKLFEEAENKGCIRAKNNKLVLLGEKYYYGNETQKDYKKAFELFSQVQKTNAQAKYYLAKMYLFGYGVEENEKLSENLIDEAVRMKGKDAIEFIFNYNANMVKLMQEFNLDKDIAKEIVEKLDSLNAGNIKNIVQNEDEIIDVETQEDGHYFFKCSLHKST